MKKNILIILISTVLTSIQASVGSLRQAAQAGKQAVQVARGATRNVSGAAQQAAQIRQVTPKVNPSLQTIKGDLRRGAQDATDAWYSMKNIFTKSIGDAAQMAKTTAQQGIKTGADSATNRLQSLGKQVQDTALSRMAPNFETGLSTSAEVTQPKTSSWFGSLKELGTKLGSGIENTVKKYSEKGYDQLKKATQEAAAIARRTGKIAEQQYHDGSLGRYVKSKIPSNIGSRLGLVKSDNNGFTPQSPLAKALAEKSDTERRIEEQKDPLRKYGRDGGTTIPKMSLNTRILSYGGASQFISDIDRALNIYKESPEKVREWIAQLPSLLASQEHGKITQRLITEYLLNGDAYYRDEPDTFAPIGHALGLQDISVENVRKALREIWLPNLRATEILNGTRSPIKPEEFLTTLIDNLHNKDEYIRQQMQHNQDLLEKAKGFHFSNLLADNLNLSQSNLTKQSPRDFFLHQLQNLSPQERTALVNYVHELPLEEQNKLNQQFAAIEPGSFNTLEFITPKDMLVAFENPWNANLSQLTKERFYQDIRKQNIQQALRKSLSQGKDLAEILKESKDLHRTVDNLPQVIAQLPAEQQQLYIEQFKKLPRDKGDDRFIKLKTSDYFTFRFLVDEFMSKYNKALAQQEFALGGEFSNGENLSTLRTTDTTLAPVDLTILESAAPQPIGADVIKTLQKLEGDHHQIVGESLSNQFAQRVNEGTAGKPYYSREDNFSQSSLVIPPSTSQDNTPFQVGPAPEKSLINSLTEVTQGIADSASHLARGFESLDQFAKQRGLDKDGLSWNEIINMYGDDQRIARTRGIIYGLKNGLSIMDILTTGGKGYYGAIDTDKHDQLAEILATMSITDNIPVQKLLADLKRRVPSGENVIRLDESGHFVDPEQLADRVGFYLKKLSKNPPFTLVSEKFDPLKPSSVIPYGGGNLIPQMTDAAPALVDKAPTGMLHRWNKTWKIVLPKLKNIIKNLIQNPSLKNQAEEKVLTL